MLMSFGVGRSDRAVRKQQARRTGELRLTVDEKHTLSGNLISWFQAGSNHVNIVA